MVAEACTRARARAFVCPATAPTRSRHRIPPTTLENSGSSRFSLTQRCQAKHDPWPSFERVHNRVPPRTSRPASCVPPRCVSAASPPPRTPAACVVSSYKKGRQRCGAGDRQMRVARGRVTSLLGLASLGPCRVVRGVEAVASRVRRELVGVGSQERVRARVGTENILLDLDLDLVANVPAAPVERSRAAAIRVDGGCSRARTPPVASRRERTP
ncbi:hypothetical protein MSAN_02489900 [Mycena sanguinolenta]|uniref:Uncharacterized protein n=1 Tax=Mycena sanguinolenta TaxID=230812 RepID=A0A8H6U301_9AGAR|nr:hypothetical protein MSAN_02489900 [Mycena sanguinolenta]